MPKVSRVAGARLDRSVVLLVLAAMLPLLACAAAMGVKDLSQQHDAMRDRARDATARLSDLVRREVNAVQDTLSVLAASPMLDAGGDLGRYGDLLARARKVVPLLVKLSLRSPDGRTLASSSAGMAALGKGPDGAPADDKESFRAALERGEPSIGHMTTMEEGVVFAVRVPAVRDGKVAYVVSGLVSPGPIQAMLGATRLPEGWVGVVIDNSGRVVARSTDEDERVGRPATSTALEARKAGGDGFYESVSSTGGGPTVVSYHVIPDTGWSVHVSIPKDLYEAPFVRSAWIIALATTLGLGLAASFLLLLAREVRLRRRRQDEADDVERLEALGKITGGVAHDFNNILTIVMGAVDTLRRRRNEPARIDAIAEMLLAAALRGQALTTQLLAYARRSAYAPVPFRLQERVGGIVMMMEKATRPDIATTVKVADDVWPLLTDPMALENAVINLAVNARDAMPDGGRLAVTARNVALTASRDHGTGLKGDFVVVSVQDTGHGIPREIVDSVFDPFFTTKATGKGTGLGLSQVQGFARQSGGNVRIVSEVGNGTRFDLYLPRSTEEPVPTQAKAGADDVQDTGRVLLVEDNAAVAALAREMLESSGYEVTYAASAEAALALVEGPERFDAMLSDIVLEGGMSGLDAAPLVSSMRPDLPIVLMTGYSEALASGSSRGFPVVSKPFLRGEVVRAIIAAKAKRLREGVAKAPHAAREMRSAAA